MPIIGIVASSITNALWPANSYESIATVTVGAGGSASVSFSSIPATYSHLQIRLTGRTNRNSTMDSVKVTFNSDTGTNYTEHGLYASAGSVAAYGATSATGSGVYRVAAANAASGIQGAIVVDVLDYANTNKYKTLRSLGGCDLNGGGELYSNSGLWLSTSAINSVTLTPIGTIQQYSSFALYGIKVAA